MQHFRQSLEPPSTIISPTPYIFMELDCGFPSHPHSSIMAESQHHDAYISLPHAKASFLTSMSECLPKRLDVSVCVHLSVHKFVYARTYCCALIRLCARCRACIFCLGTHLNASMCVSNYYHLVVCIF
ncbi:LOW QUALITY PROTEIN: hypothetical protein PanWU01x14_087120 [Parasponia andersonii]|uniref:Uncharacterized protein n=1 Tax=Parasponia andersonii TaxID=3476 RepID=A0A2P5D8F4_PARAD|nr:LOW QUALITY PROTEIN: hypothetical protein PanWU01x14_087120 [Parasponia andersonii]